MKSNISTTELRNIQLEMLQFIDDFCSRNDIDYSLAFGTLLGAVRHRGFIPWDDDIDIAMLRPDYEKFRRLFKDASDTYELLDCRDDENYSLPFAKVHNIHTYIYQGVSSTKNTGIFIDVFPLDYLPDTYSESKRIRSLIKLYRLILNTKHKNFRIIRKWWKILFVYFLKFIFLPVSAHSLAVKMNELCTRHPGASYICHLQDLTDNPFFDKHIWQTSSKRDFEDRKFRCIDEYDEYLKLLYGDYMKLPPKEQQVAKHDFIEVYRI